MKKFKWLIVNLQYNVSGIFFYTLEYLNYLLDEGFDVYLLTKYPKSMYNFYINDKYDSSKLNPEFFNRIIYNINISYTDNLIILDMTSFNKFRGKIIFKKLYYNYYNDLSSLRKTFKEKYTEMKKSNIVIFGDKELGAKVDYHYPLCIDFSILKKINNFKNNTFEEIKDKSRLLRKRLIRNFHQNFNKLKLVRQGFFDRANRLIPECKFYNKEIEFIDEIKSKFKDSIYLRLERDWKDYQS
jgi:hypothetical protein